MRKFLSALNLVCVIFISGCNKNSSNFKKYDLSFSEVLNSSLVLDFVNGSVFSGSLSLPNLNFPSDVHSSVFNINDFVLFETIYSFYRDNGVKNGEILMIEKLLKLEISLNKIDYGSYGYEITSFSAEMPNKN
ncbi:hypothetical protein [Spiroplasma endosymbiont of Eupeodes luniger]|uniref:hypothetical protein n=1 Tax=Spiroplasma endosymbiont of Eupeodes luniger TaxID=3066300 RepID=UPI0030D0EC40